MTIKFTTSFLGSLLSCALMAQTPTLQWAKAMGSNGGDGANSIAVDNNGNVLTTGYFVNTADLDPSGTTLNYTSAGGKDVFISKLDASGVLVWAKQIGGTGVDEGTGIATDAVGDVYVSGNFESSVDLDPDAGILSMTSAGMADIFVIKLSGTNGSLLWAAQLGGTGAELSKAIGVASDLSVYTTGQFSGTSDFNPGSASSFNLTSSGIDIFVSKLDASGNFAWANQMGGTGTDVALGLAVTSTNDVYTTGYFNGTADLDPGTPVASVTSNGGDDIFISRLDASGNYQWGKNVGGSAADRGYWIATNASGNAFLTGFFNDTADFDPGASTVNLSSLGTGDVFILNLDAGGNFVWVKQMGGATDNVGHCIAADNTGNTYIVGVFQGSMDVDPGSGILTLTAAGPNDIFTVALDPSGNLIWSAQAGSTGADLGETIAVDAAGTVYASGVFTGTADFDPGTNTSTLTSAGSADVFVMKLNSGLPTGIKAISIPMQTLFAYPNPCREQVTVETNEGTLRLYNILGEAIKVFAVQQGKITIDMQDFPEGIYLLEANGKVCRIIKD